MQTLTTPSHLRPGFDVHYFVGPLADLVAWQHDAPADVDIAWDAVDIGNGEWCVAGYSRRAALSSGGEQS